MKKFFKLTSVLCILLAVPQITKAQIGYQVSLLNTATGEPQANKTVNVNIAITNAENEVVHTEIQTATTNDFGILSLSVGNEDTFKNADWNKLPFYISVSVDGTLIGKSQILTVPVAEYAKTAGPVLTKEMVVGTWSNRHVVNMTGQEREYYYYITFNEDGTGVATDNYGRLESIQWEIIGARIYTYVTMENVMEGYGLLFSSEPYSLRSIYSIHPEKNKLIEVTKSISAPYIYSKE